MLTQHSTKHYRLGDVCVCVWAGEAGCGQGIGVTSKEVETELTAGELCPDP